MRTSSKFALLALLSLGSGIALAQTGLSYGRAAGVGLKPLEGTSVETYQSNPVLGSQAAVLWQSTKPFDYALYGARDEARLGLRATASYAGVVYALRGGWGSSLEAGVQDSPLTPRRYAVAGRLHTLLSDGGTLSVGLKYQGADPQAVLRNGYSGEFHSGSSYTLAPSRQAGNGYSVHMSYQYSPAGSIGLALGREVETFTPLPDAFVSGPRQFSFTGQHWLTPSWALSYDVLSHDLASPLRLQGLRLGVRYRF